MSAIARRGNRPRNAGRLCGIGEKDTGRAAWAAVGTIRERVPLLDVSEAAIALWRRHCFCEAVAHGYVNIHAAAHAVRFADA